MQVVQWLRSECLPSGCCRGVHALQMRV
jgi:hypothetical protein